MKKLQKGCAVTLLIGVFCFFCGCVSAYPNREWQYEVERRQRIGESLQLDLLDSVCIEHWSNRGWFADGNELTVLELSENALAELYEKIDEEKSKWHALPFSEESYDLVYGGSGYFTDHRDDTNVLPYIENGYWWSTCYKYENEGEPEVCVAANFDFALFDADMGRLYYYEFDS